MTSDPGTPPVTCRVLLAVAYLRLLRYAVRFRLVRRVLPRDRVAALAGPFLRAGADAWLREQGQSRSN